MRLETTILALLVTLTGCGDDESVPPSSTGPGNDPPGAEADSQPPSPHAAVRFKGGDVLATDLAQALALDPSELCNELGRYGCTDTVHVVTLGGVDPYERQIYESMRQTSAATPLAAERVVLAACLERARRDLASPGEAVVFVGLPLDGARLADASAPSVGAAIDRLYTGLLARHPAPGETSALTAYYAEIEASGEAAAAERWAALACFAIGSSTEALFY